MKRIHILKPSKFTPTRIRQHTPCSGCGVQPGNDHEVGCRFKKKASESARRLR